MVNITGHIPISFQPKRQPRTYSLEEYMRLEAKAKDKHEFINGQIIKMPYAKAPHNIISANISAEMRFGLKKLPTKYVIFSSDQQIYFPSLNAGVYADALAVCEKPVYWDKEKLLLVNPIIVVEVLSRSTSKYDRAGKFDKYKTLESIQEYILIRQEESYVEIWFRESPGRWTETIVKDRTQFITLQSVGIQIAMSDIYENIDL
jgi:Uma2 family endonuclease